MFVFSLQRSLEAVKRMRNSRELLGNFWVRELKFLSAADVEATNWYAERVEERERDWSIYS